MSFLAFVRMYPWCFICLESNKPGTAQDGAISYLRFNRTRKPLFLQLETTKALKKQQIEEKIFPEIFLKFPVSRIVPKNVKGGPFGVFLNIHSVAKYKKIDGGTLWSNKKISEKMRNLKVPKK